MRDNVAAEEGKIDPMHQFEVQTIFPGFEIGGHEIAFTNSALWMLVTLGALWLFMLGGMKRELVPGRWQAAVEGVTGFISSMMNTNIGPEGRKFTPYVFSLFMFILFANLLGMMPIGVLGLHPVHGDSHLTITGVLAIVSFAIVLGSASCSTASTSSPVRAARRALVDASDPDPGRIRLLHGPAVQPRAASVRGDDGGPHPPEGARRLRHQRHDAEAAWVAPSVSLRASS
jgi:hypothetical protein